MSVTKVDPFLPRPADIGGNIPAKKETEGMSTTPSTAAQNKPRFVGPGIGKGVTRGLTRAVRRPSEHGSLNSEPGEHHYHHHHPQLEDMTISNKPKNINLIVPTPDVEDNNDDDEFIDELSALGHETPIPPLPRARVPSRLGASSALPPEHHDHGETPGQGMMLIGRPASTASYNRIATSHEDHHPRKRGESSLAQTPSTPLFPEMESPITSIEEDLKQLLLCQTMGIKVVTVSKDFVPGSVAQLVFHCPRCLKHWKMSGKPKAPEDCTEVEEPTHGPEFKINNRSHQIMQQIDMLPEEDKNHLMKVLSRTGSPGAEEELLDLVNSASNGFLRQSSASPHASRRSRSPDKRGVVRKQDSPGHDITGSSPSSPVDRIRMEDAGQIGHVTGVEQKRWKSADYDRDSGIGSPRHGTFSALAKVSRNRIDSSPLAKEDESYRRTYSDFVEEVESKADQDLNIEQASPQGISYIDQRSYAYKATSSSHQHLSQSQSYNIPKGERSSTGQRIYEFQDVDGAKYHGFLTETGQFIPIARLDSTGNRIPIALKSDGGYCIIGKDGCQPFPTLGPPRNGTSGKETTTCHGEELIDMQDSSGAIIRGYRNTGGSFVPILKMNLDGTRNAIFMKPDGRYYIKNEGDLGEQIIKIPMVDAINVENKMTQNPKHIVKERKVSSLKSQTTPALQEDAEEIIEFDGHDGFRYEGIHIPGIGFVPTARLGKDSERRPIVLNRDGSYSVINKNGIMEEVKVQCHQAVKHDSQQDCTVCKIVGMSQSKSGTLFKRMSSSSSSYSSDGSIITSSSQTEVRKRKQYKPDMSPVLQTDALKGVEKPFESSAHDISHKLNSLTLKRGLDGSMYHGRCSSNHFVPIFRFDVSGIRQPVLRSLSGKYYVIDDTGKSRYIDGTKDKDAVNMDDVITKEVDNYKFEGNYTIDGRFVPIAKIDSDGNRQPVALSKDGRYIFVGEKGNVANVNFDASENIKKSHKPLSVKEKLETRSGTDGFKYEGYQNDDGKFIPTYQIDTQSGYRQMVLRNSKGQGYVIGQDGASKIIPFTFNPREGKSKSKRNLSKKSLKMKGKSSKDISMKADFVDAYRDDDDATSKGAIFDSSHIKINAKVSKSNVDDYKEKSENKMQQQAESHPISGDTAEAYAISRTKKSEICKGDFSAWPHENSESLEQQPNEDEKMHTASKERINRTLYLDIENESEKDEEENVGTMTKLYDTTATLEANQGDRESVKQPLASEAKSRARKHWESVKTYMGVSDATKDYEKVEESNGTKKLHKKSDTVDKSGKEDGGRKGTAKNPAVHNVTGKPDTKAGQFKKHMFATPQEDLANTMALNGTRRGSKVADNVMEGESKTSLNTKSTRLPSLTKAPQLPASSDNDSKDRGNKKGGVGDDLFPMIPPQGRMDRKPGTLPPIGQEKQSDFDAGEDQSLVSAGQKGRRGSKGGKEIKKKMAPENRRRASKAPDTQMMQEQETSAAKWQDQKLPRDRSLSPAELNKYSRFKLTTDDAPSISPPLPSMPTSDSQPSYRMAYSTLPGRMRSPTLPTTEPFAGQLSKTPEPAFYQNYQRQQSPIDNLTLPESGEFVIAKSRQSASPTKRGPLMTSKSSVLSRPSTRLLAATDSIPESISKIWKQHEQEVEMMRQSFFLSLTGPFTFSYFELPSQYANQNSLLMRKAKQIRTMKKPTKLGKPPIRGMQKGKGVQQKGVKVKGAHMVKARG